MPEITPNLHAQTPPAHVSDTDAIERALHAAAVEPSDTIAVGTRHFLRQRPTCDTPADTDPSIEPAVVTESCTRVVFEFNDGDTVVANTRAGSVVAIGDGGCVMDVYRDTDAVRAAYEVVCLREALARERYLLWSALDTGYVPAVELGKQLLRVRSVEAQLEIAYARLCALV